jgi:mannose-6-phosphate isomerase-like protein (cupin superfamily)
MGAGQLIVLGVDDQGRSCVVEKSGLDRQAVAPGASVTRANLATIEKVPPPPVPVGLSRFRPNVLEPGQVTWSVIDHPPRDPDIAPPAAPDMHWRDVVDFLFVVQGSGTLTLGVGSEAVKAGDCIVMAGSDHGFRADAGGCQLMSFAIGATPAAAAE